MANFQGIQDPANASQIQEALKQEKLRRAAGTDDGSWSSFFGASPLAPNAAPPATLAPTVPIPVAPKASLPKDNPIPKRPKPLSNGKPEAVKKLPNKSEIDRGIVRPLVDRKKRRNDGLNVTIKL